MTNPRKRRTRVYHADGSKGWTYVGDRGDTALLRIVRRPARRRTVCETCLAVIDPGEEHLAWSRTRRHVRCMRPGCRPPRAALTRDPLKELVWGMVDAFQPAGATPAAVADELRTFATGFVTAVQAAMQAIVTRAQNAGRDDVADDMLARIDELGVYVQRLRSEATSIAAATVRGSVTIESLRERAAVAAQGYGE